MTTKGASTTFTLWQRLGKSAANNPTILLLGLLLGAFTAGWTVRTFFEVRELRKLQNTVTDKKAQLEALKTQLTAATIREKRLSEKRDAILPFVLDEVPGMIRKSIAVDWPEQLRQPVIASGTRQLVSSGGTAKFLTPSGMLVTLNVHEDNGKIESSVNRQDYNLIRDSLREQGFEPSTDDLRRLYTDLTFNGAASIQFSSGGKRFKLVTLLDPSVGIALYTIALP